MRPAIRFLAVSAFIGLAAIFASTGAMGAYDSAKRDNLCRRQLDQLNDAWHKIVLLGSIGTGVLLVVIFAMCAKSATSVGSAIINAEATALGILIIVWALTLAIAVVATRCKTDRTAELWASVVLFFPGVALWVMRPREPDL